jgi:hypothetical protein
MDSINLKHFKTMLQAFYDQNPVAFHAAIMQVAKNEARAGNQAFGLELLEAIEASKYAAFAKRLSDTRKARKISRAKLAELCGLTVADITDAENNKRAVVFPPELPTYLEVDSYWLWHGANVESHQDIGFHKCH